AFYRLCRMLHAYLSAFAFLALIFFALTGLLLDHPDWLQGKPREQEVKLAVPAALLAKAAHDKDPSAALAATVARLTPLVGAYKSGEIDDGEANLRFEGTKGASTVTVDLRNGATDVDLQHASVVSVINDLHRGKNAGAAWRLVIDISAVVILALSLVGYVLFFSLRFRLRTSLILTAVSLGVLIGVFVLLTP
ncbi:MAG: PepSY-associated TM helix domain-containing protein, partial [Caulobacteraceae bacterium]